MTALCRLCGELIISPELAWSSLTVTEAERQKIFVAELRRLGPLVAAHMGQRGHAEVEKQMLIAMSAAGQDIAMRYVSSSDPRFSEFFEGGSPLDALVSSSASTQSGL